MRRTTFFLHTQTYVLALRITTRIRHLTNLHSQTLTGETTPGADFIEFLAKFNEAGQESLEATNRINASIKDIEESIEQMNKADDEDDEDEDLSSKRKTKAGIVISAKEAGSVKLILTYGKSPYLPSYVKRIDIAPFKSCPARAGHQPTNSTHRRIPQLKQSPTPLRSTTAHPSYKPQARTGTT